MACSQGLLQEGKLPCGCTLPFMQDTFGWNLACNCETSMCLKTYALTDCNSLPSIHLVANPGLLPQHAWNCHFYFLTFGCLPCLHTFLVELFGVEHSLTTDVDVRKDLQLVNTPHWELYTTSSHIVIGKWMQQAARIKGACELGKCEPR